MRNYSKRNMITHSHLLIFCWCPLFFHIQWSQNRKASLPRKNRKKLLELVRKQENILLKSNWRIQKQTNKVGMFKPLGPNKKYFKDGFFHSRDWEGNICCIYLLCCSCYLYVDHLHGGFNTSLNAVKML